MRFRTLVSNKCACTKCRLLFRDGTEYETRETKDYVLATLGILSSVRSAVPIGLPRLDPRNQPGLRSRRVRHGGKLHKLKPLKTGMMGR